MEDYQKMLETAKLWYIQAIIWAGIEVIRIERIAEGYSLCKHEQECADFCERLILGQVVITEKHLEGLNTERLNLVEYVRHAEIVLGNGTYTVPADGDRDAFLHGVFDYKWALMRKGRSERRRPINTFYAAQGPRPLPLPE